MEFDFGARSRSELLAKKKLPAWAGSYSTVTPWILVWTVSNQEMRMRLFIRLNSRRVWDDREYLLSCCGQHLVSK